MPRTSTLLPTALLALLAAVPVRGDDAGAPAGERPLAAVEIRLDHGLGRPLDLESYVAFAPGDVLGDDAVRRTLQNLNATGLFERVEVLTRDEPEGPVAIVALTSHTWVDTVDVVGETGELRRDDLLRATSQERGDPLVEERLLKSVYALQDLYAERGYLRAKVFLRVVPEKSGKEVGVVFDVTSGPRAEIGSVSLDGDLGPLDLLALTASLRSTPGNLYDYQRAVDDADRLRAELVRQGRLKAVVQAPQMRYDPEPNLVHLVYPVDTGPEIRVEVVGAELEDLKKKGLLPFLGEQVYDEALVWKSRDAIRAFYQQKGHYQARVETHERRLADGTIVLHLEIEPGEVFGLDEILFTGNENVADGELLRLMETAHKGLSLGGRHLVDQVLREDIDTLRSFYMLQGFSDVEIGPEVVRVDERTLHLTLPIREGRRRRVVDLRLHGVEALDPEAVRRELPLGRGGPFHPVLLDDSLKVLRALYEEEGYAEALVTPRLDWNREGTLVDVDVLVQEGRRSRVDRVILRGHRRTRPDVLERFVDLDEGDVISRRRLLETERELYRLGIFSRVDVEVAPMTDSTGLRDVVIELEEARRYRLAYGLSYHSDDGPGGLLSLSRVNIGGRGDRLQLDLRANSRDRRFRLIYDQPSLGPLDVPITYTLFRQDEERDAFTVRDLGVQAALTKDLPRVRLGLSYDYRLVDLLEVTVDPTDIERQDREVQISSLTPNLFVDRRDDPVEPTRGSLSLVQLEVAFPLITATANFAKLFVQQTGYVGLGRFGVLAASFRLGAIEPLDPNVTPDPLVPAGLASALIPVSERFYAGGRTTHRAYERDELGVPGETLLDRGGQLFETGGNGLVLLNLDYRFPIAGAFGGTFFFDLGNVWADWRDVDTADLKPGVGIGLRYSSPIGPVRIEIGWKLDAERGEDSPVFFLSLGNPF